MGMMGYKTPNIDRIAAAGDPTVKADFLKGRKVGDMTYKVHFVGEWLQSFKEFPPRQKPGSFSLDRVLESIAKGAGDK